MRGLGHDRMLPYWTRDHQYEAAALQMRYSGVTPDAAVVGSSRAREGVHMPTMEAVLRAELGRKVSVSNFAGPGAQASHVVRFVHTLLREDGTGMLVYALGPRSLLPSNVPLRYSAQFLTTSDFMSDNPTIRSHARDHWPIVVRAELSSFYRTLAYRSRPGVTLARAAATLRGDDLGQGLGSLLKLNPIPSPLTGDETILHTRERRMSLVRRPIPEERVRMYVQRLAVDDEYEFATNQLAALEEIIEMCAQSGVPLVFVEVPVSDVLARHWPAGTQKRFLEKMHDLAAAHDVTFVPASDLELTLTDKDFLEQSHLNAGGAETYTAEVAARVVAPRLKR